MSSISRLWNQHQTGQQTNPAGQLGDSSLNELLELRAEVAKLRAKLASIEAGESYSDDLGPGIDLDNLHIDVLDNCAVTSSYDSEKDFSRPGLSGAVLEQMIISRAAKYGFINAEQFAEQAYRKDSYADRDIEARRIATICEELGFELNGSLWIVADCAAIIQDKIKRISQLPQDAPDWWRRQIAQALLRQRSNRVNLRTSAYDKRLKQAASLHFGGIQ